MLHPIHHLRGVAISNAYATGKPAAVVLDSLERRIRVFADPHWEYLESEPSRYLVLEVRQATGHIA